MPVSDRDYFTRRAREERGAAARAGSEEARAPHALLAERYADVAAALEEAGEQADAGARRAIISRVSIDAERKSATLTSPAADAPVPPIPPADTEA